MALTVRTDRGLIRAQGGSVRHALVELAAPEAPSRSDRVPLNVALVLDRSGSMGGQKIVVARQAVAHALQLLKPRDRFSLVAFDDVVDVVVASTPAAAEAKRHALGRLAHIDARGSTNLAGGWEAGCTQAATHLAGDAVGRCLLVTDGQANVGESNPGQLGALAAAMRQRGVATSTFGIGADFDERTLQLMADGGRGHFYFVETPQAIPDLLASELGDILEIVAREAALVLHVPDGVNVEPLGPFRVASAGHVVRIELGDLTSGQELRVVLRLTFPAGTVGEGLHVRFGLTDKENALVAESHDLAWTFAGHAENDAQRRDRVVDRAVASLYAAVARQAALQLNHERRFDEARQVIERVARKIASYAGSDPELQRIVAELRGEIDAFAMDMDAIEAKRRHFASYATQHLRTAEGKSRKRR
jgi:Ca-activated chloride channel family protein